MPPVFPLMGDLLPHAPPMVLLDEVIDWSADSVTTGLTIRPDTPFFVTGQGIACHVGIEYMAQTCGAFAGLEARLAGRPVRLGFLLGTRHYHASAAWLAEGWRITVTATAVFREGPMGVFDCRIRHGDQEVAVARLTLYQPDEATNAPPDAKDEVG